MGGGNAQKSKMARERNLEKLKGGKGNGANSPFSWSSDLVGLPDLILSVFFLLILRREPARGQQEGHEHPVQDMHADFHLHHL
uniref:Small EDRK-rich factor-like N-terminal domain-containing protein n=1 Tax=Aegilops tauschii subsp. strangulata TaxID=200361 RepID=A0A453BPJ3_AEGTS